MPRRVLVIDDDEMMLNTLQDLLYRGGYEVLSTADGPQGITIFKERHPELVLLDFGLPSMNGLEVLRKIRDLDAQARVVVVTGHASDESAQVALRNGALSYLTKPVDPDALLQMLDAQLNS